LRGEVLLRSGRLPEGRTVLENVEVALRALPGPDAWIQALFRLELIARAARDAGDWTLAGITGRQLMEHDPSYAGSHLALALVALHGGRAAEAARSFAAAETYWRDADPDLPELREIRSRARPLS
jgi:hypothetical protein